MADTPVALALVESFLNSLDVESGADDLGSLTSYTRWLRQHGQPSTGVTGPDLELARQLRYALRAAAHAHHDGPGTAHAPDGSGAVDLGAATVTGQIRLRATLDSEGVGLASAEAGGRAVLGTVLAAVVLAARDGTWQRLKICREDTCQWVFYDQSKNTSKQWCSMRVCGNRNKTRAYRSRQRG